MVVGVDMVGNKGDVLKILQERIPHLTTKKGITMKQNNMEMDEVYKINPQKPMKKNCLRCGMKGHWQRTCCMPKHLVDLYQASIKEKGKGIKINFAHHSDPEDHMDYSDIPNKVDITHLDVSDFFEDANGKIDHLIGDRNVNTN